MNDSGIIISLPRVGLHGKTIHVYKLRTMIPGAQHLQAFVFASNGLTVNGKFANDPRITSVGHILRKYFLDELPMLINLVKGDMKLVGVRPISEHYFSLYDDEVQRRRIQYKPGLIPPYYADLPRGLDQMQKSEMKYFDAYDRQPVLTDIYYFLKAMVNIVFRFARSN